MSESSWQDIKNKRMGKLIVGRHASHFTHLTNSSHYSQGDIYFEHVGTFTFFYFSKTKTEFFVFSGKQSD